MRALTPGDAVRVRVPASSANLGPGFDSIGLALGVWDAYGAEVTAAPGLRIDVLGDGQGVPSDERHLVYATMRRAWALAGVAEPRGLRLTCRSVIPQGKGLGSSAAAIVAGVAAAHALARLAEHSADGAAEPLIGLDAVNDLAGALEGHPDNASASVYGGLTLSWVEHDSAVVTGDVEAAGPHRVHSERVPLHPDVEPVVVVPGAQLPTATARAVLPTQVLHAQAALNSARCGLLVLALTARPDLLLPATREWLHQEQRRSSLGEAMELIDALRAAGLAAVISGAGPSVLVLATREQAGEVARRMPPGWEVLRPGVPDSGVHVQRGTLDELPGESSTSA